jgi:uncharacterized protein (TIGR02147 family)
MSIPLKPYEYLDAQLFLRDLYELKKNTDSKFTVRYIAEKAGLKSSGHVTNILQGKVNLPSKLVLRIALTFELNKQETEYLGALVAYKNAKNLSEKKICFERLMALKRSRVKNLDTNQYEYFSKWHNVAVRECLDFFLFDNDFEALAAKLKPPITVAQAKKSIEILSSMGLIKKNPEGFYVKSEAVVSVEEWSSLAINNFQLAMIDLAKASMDNTPPANRSFSGLTVSISEAGIVKLKEKIKRFRQEILEMVQDDNDIDQVFQININAFPLTQKNGEAKK